MSLDLLKELHNTYWFDHQSPKTCVLGSNGVGHDIIHPLDRLQSACRNAWAMHHSVESLDEEIQLKEIERLRLIAKKDKTDKNSLDEYELAIKIKRSDRELGQLEMAFKDRKTALEAHMSVVKETYPMVTAKWKHLDEGLEEVWMARVAYNAQVKNHPLGQELKVALMSEVNKQHLLDMMGFPTEIGGNPLPAPNADAVLNAITGVKEIDDGKKLRTQIR